MCDVTAGTELPDMSEVHPTNVTETRGGRAKFHCWVQSASQPEVEWLKRFPDGLREDMNRLYANTSLVIGQDHYQSMTCFPTDKEIKNWLECIQVEHLVVSRRPKTMGFSGEEFHPFIKFLISDQRLRLAL